MIKPTNNLPWKEVLSKNKKKYKALRETRRKSSLKSLRRQNRSGDGGDRRVRNHRACDDKTKKPLFWYFVCKSYKKSDGKKAKVFY